jgi:hypothetical protein
MTALGRTIKLFLADGHPAGLIIAEILSRTGKVLTFPRGLLPQVLKHRPELKNPGIYLLIGSDPEHPSRPLLYIGESDTVGQRLVQHDRDENKAFFEQVTLIVSKDENLTKGHVRYLEARLIEIARQQALIQIKNGNLGQPVSLPESDVADMEYFLQQIRTVLPVLGHTFFQELPQKQVKAITSPRDSEPLDTESIESPVFELSYLSGLVHAEGYESEGQFIVSAGAVCRHPDKITDSFKQERFEYIVNDLNDCLSAGILQPKDDAPHDLVVLTQDKSFKSPSRAACFVMGKSINGRTSWRLKGSFQTYGDWREAQLNPAISSTGV